MKTDPRFENVQIEKDTLCPDCGYLMIKGSCAHKKIDDSKIYCASCYREMRIEE